MATSVTLPDIARNPGLSPERARKLALANTFVDTWRVELSRTDPPQDWVVATLRRAYALATSLGASDADWRALRSELIAKGIRSAERTPEDEPARWR